MIDIDSLYYICCVKVRLSERDFWKSSVKKILFILNMLKKELKPEDTPQEAREITSMKEIPGWI